MAEFNYGITIPQPNTSGFGGGLLQGLATIQQIRGAQAQQALAQQLAPYELQKMQLGIQGMQQSMAQSAAAAGRAATSFAQEQEMRRTAMEQQRTIANSIAQYGSNPNADLSSLTSVIPYLSKQQLDAIQSVEQIKVANIASKIDKDNPDPYLIQQVAARSMALPSADANKFFALYSQIPDKVQQSLKNTAIEVTNAGLAGKPDIALKRLQEQSDALSNSEDPKLKELGAFYQRTIEATPENAPPSYWGMLGTLFTMRTGDKEATATVSKVLTDYYKEGSPEAMTKAKADAAKAQAEANLSEIKAKAEQLKLEGGMPADEMFKAEKEMRDTFTSQPIVRAYQDRRVAVQAIDDSLKQKNPIGDQISIVQLIRLNDPTSTVSVTESGQIQTTGLSGTIKTLVEKFNGTGKLNEDQRKQISVLSKTLMNTYQKEFDAFKGQTERIASEAGLRPKNIVAFPTAPLTFEKAKSTQTAAEAARGKSVPPPIPTASPAAPAAPTAPSIDDLLKKYSR
jgi:hypothetical protein